MADDGRVLNACEVDTEGDRYRLWSRRDVAFALRILERKAHYVHRRPLIVACLTCTGPGELKPTDTQSGMFEIHVPSAKNLPDNYIESTWNDTSLIHEIWHVVQQTHGIPAWYSGSWAQDWMHPMYDALDIAVDLGERPRLARAWAEYWRVRRMYWRHFPQERQAHLVSLKLAGDRVERAYQKNVMLSEDVDYYAMYPEELLPLSNYGYFIGEDRALFPHVFDPEEQVTLVDPVPGLIADLT